MNDDIRTWKGIRYARTPDRFAAPVVVVSATPAAGGHFGHAPMQVPPSWAQLGAEVSEDCLTLNVWAPEGTHLPVLVWVFGGGFENGAASMFDGEALARAAGCVVVTINYRVGSFGFSTLSPFAPALADASNLGLRDVLAALEWVHESIAGFGGDPAKITLAGQSAGAFLVCAAAVAPDALPIRALALFSGGASRIVPEEIAHDMGAALLAELGLESDPGAIALIDPELLLAAQRTLITGDIGDRNSRRPRALGVALDPHSPTPVVPRHPLEVIADGALRDVAILVGATTDEVFGFPPQMLGDPDQAALTREIEAATDHAGDARRLIEHYGTGAPSARARFLTDYIYRLPAVRLAETQRRAGGRAWLLEISRVADDPAVHGDDVNALFARAGDADDTRAETILGAYRQLIVEGELSAGPRHPIVAGAALAPDVVPLERLTDLWQGVARP